MLRATRYIRTTLFPSPYSNVVGIRKSTGTGNRFHQVPAGSANNNKTDIDKMDSSQEAKKTTEKGDVMSHSFGEGYSTRSDEEGFGGIYSGNQSLNKDEQDKIVHGNAPEYDKNQGSEVKEKEKGRHQTNTDSLRVSMLRIWRGQNVQPKDDSSELDAKVEELRTALGPLSGRSLKFCNDPCLRRYLVARNWNVDKAKHMLEETLKWISNFKPEEIRWHEVAHEGETGKAFRANFHDRSGRTVLIMNPGKQNTTSAEGNIRHLVYLLENAILNLPEGQEQMSWLIDFNGWSLSNSVPIKTARDIIYMLQNHYPERLAIVVQYSPPRIFEAFWKVVKFFVDSNSSQKIKFVYPNNNESTEIIKSFFDAENLPSEFGGKASLKYDHEEFSRQKAEDDVKTAKFWGFEYKPCNDMNGKAG